VVEPLHGHWRLFSRPQLLLSFFFVFANYGTTPTHMHEGSGRIILSNLEVAQPNQMAKIKPKK
jgi:hypothetical protein